MVQQQQDLMISHSLMENIPYKKILKSVVLDCTLFCLVLFFYFQNILHCPLRYYFNIECPLCGMTRAVLSFFKGDIKQAFMYHPLFPIPFIFYILTLGYRYNLITNKVLNIISTVFAVLFIIVYILKMRSYF